MARLTQRLALAALCSAALGASPAHAAPNRNQMRAAEKINALLNERRDWAELPQPCIQFATNKAFAMIVAGVPGTALAIVKDEAGKWHEVAEVKSGDQTMVYDSRFTWPMSRKDLEAHGYVWVFEFIDAGKGN